MSALVAFSVTPLGVGEHVGRLVADAVKVVRDSGLPNRTDAMFTVVEGGSLAEVMVVVTQAIQVVAEQAPRVSTVIKIDYHPGREDGITNKVESVERHLEG
ncbi:thiamine-binding protein [Phytomonospora sp. NPDC050363]|uniref:thiamine-binding protein n=1 Tax=Phytomonospora sp. NPDC050363 TaxID=3155642 RepID=UPI0033E71180